MSAAIKIVAPSASSSVNTSPSHQPGQLPSASKRPEEKKLCRNILIYGQCRFEDKGCTYAHDPPSAEAPSQSATPTPSGLASKTPFSAASVANAAVFVPSFGGAGAAGSGSLTPGGGMGIGAQEFVPRRTGTPALAEGAAPFAPSQARGPPGLDGAGSLQNKLLDVAAGQQNGPSSSLGAGAQELAEYYRQAMDITGEYSLHHQQQSSALHGDALYDLAQQQQQQQQHPQQLGNGGAQIGHGSHGQDPYFGSQLGGIGQFVRQPLQYHLYHPLPASQPHNSHAPSHPSFFLPPSLHISLTAKSEAIHATPSVDMKLPEEVGGYVGLMPLDKGSPMTGEGQGGQGGGWAGYRSWIYKAWKEGDGKAYALRRIEGFRLQHEAAISVVEKWTRIRHPGLIAVKEAFTTRAFGDHSIVFVYDFHPTSTTLYEAHLSPLSALPPNPWSHAPGPHHSQAPHALYRRQGGSSTPLTPAGGGGVPERVIWSYVVQIGSVVKAVHNMGLAVRNLEVNRVIVTGKNRVRVGGCGILDVLQWDGGQQQGGYQQDDLLSFGKLIISLCCGSTSSVHNLPKSVDHISRMYSPDLKNVVLYLLSKPGPRKTIEEVLALMGGRVLEELNSSFVAEDTLEAELLRELENGRLVRLLAKFGFINERPEFDHDPRWAETGDRYLIKLFRDFIFHQVDENGRPVTDLSHVVTCLNKLDAGVDEKIMLVSRDEQSCLIVSYREIKNCIEGAFLDLSR